MQSTALALMSCENKMEPGKFPLVPVYDLIVFCDLGKEPFNWKGGSGLKSLNHRYTRIICGILGRGG